jgi:hypothetical protein
MKQNKVLLIIVGFIIVAAGIGVISSIVKEEVTLLPKKLCAVEEDIDIKETTELLPIKCSTTGNLLNPNHYAYTNLDGQIVLSDTDWNYASFFEDNQLAIVSSGLSSAVINKQGDNILDFSFSHIHYIGHNYYFLQADHTNYIGYYDKTENQFHIEITVYEWVYHFSEGLAAVKTSDNQIGFLDLSLKLTIDSIYDYRPEFHYLFHDGSVILSKEGLYGMINPLNESVIPFEYEHLSLLNDKLVLFEQKNQKGIMDRDGNMMLPAQYIEIGNMSSDGIVAVSLDAEKYAFYDINKQEFLTDYQFYHIADYKYVNFYHNFIAGYATTSLDGHTYQLIDLNFEPVLDNGVEGIKRMNEDIVVLMLDEGNYQIYDLKTGERINFEAKDLEIYPQFGLIAIGIEQNEEGTTVFQLINLKGEVIHPELKIYDDMNLKTLFNNKNYLQFSGEYKGNLLSSYLTENYELLWLPNDYK